MSYSLEGDCQIGTNVPTLNPRCRRHTAEKGRELSIPGERAEKYDIVKVARLRQERYNMVAVAKIAYEERRKEG